MSDDSERQEFERWFVSSSLSEYDKADAWYVWQRARAPLLERIKELEDGIKKIHKAWLDGRPMRAQEIGHSLLSSAKSEHDPRTAEFRVD